MKNLEDFCVVAVLLCLTMPTTIDFIRCHRELKSLAQLVVHGTDLVSLSYVVLRVVEVVWADGGHSWSQDHFRIVPFSSMFVLALHFRFDVISACERWVGCLEL